MSRYFFLLEERFYYFDWIVDPLPFVSQLCTALETASKLVHSTNSLVRLLLEKVEELEGVVKRGDSAIAAAKAIHNSLNPGVGSVSSRNIEQPRLWSLSRSDMLNQFSIFQPHFVGTCEMIASPPEYCNCPISINFTFITCMEKITTMISTKK